MGCTKSSSKREVYSNKILLQETRNISNKQPNLTSHQQLEGTQISKTPSAFIVCRHFTNGILNVVWWYLFIVWICMRLIIPGIELLSTSAFFFFFKLNGGTYLFKLFPWKVCRVLNSCGHYLHQDIFWGQVSFTALY